MPWGKTKSYNQNEKSKSTLEQGTYGTYKKKKKL